MLIKLLSGSAFFILACTGYGQLKQSKRYEIPVSDKEAEYHVASAKTSGALIYRYGSNKRSDFLDLIHLDTAFNERWKNQLELEKKFTLVHQRTLGDFQYMLFYHRELATLNFHIYSIRLQDGTQTKYLIENYIPFIPTHLEVTSKGALIGGYYIGHVPVVLYFSFTTLKTNVLPGLVNETGELIQIRVSADDSFQILIGAKNFMKQKTIWIKLYNPDGTLKQNTSLQPPENSSLLFGKVIETETDNLIVAGTYGNRTSEYSKGLFIVTTNNQGDQIQYLYPFTDLDNFFNYMKAKRQKRIKEKIERRKIKGKKIRLQYRILVHELVFQNNQYLLLGEAFYPVFKRDDRYNYGLATSLAIPYIFDGYRYTHAIVIGFNQQGQLQWDNSFEINDIKTFTLEQFVKMDAQSDKIALLYLFDNRIRTKILQGSRVLEGKNYNPLLLDYQPDESVEDDADIRKLEYWYNGTFLAYGVERPPSRSMSRSRQRLFFLNKITYR